MSAKENSQKIDNKDIETQAQDTYQSDKNSNSDQVFKKAKEEQTNSSGFVIGVLLVATGLYLYLVHLFPGLVQFNKYILLVIGLYLIVSFWILKIHKVFFFLGEVLLVLWLGSMLEDITSKKYILAILLLLLGLGMVFYATYFRVRIRKKIIGLRFLVVGIIVSFLGCLLLLTAMDSFSFSVLWNIFRPLVIILFGVVLINRWLLEKQLNKTKKSSDEYKENDEKNKK